jgi:hypothetical protein
MQEFAQIRVRALSLSVHAEQPKLVVAFPSRKATLRDSPLYWLEVKAL